MKFVATKQKVLNRGVPPDSFIAELVKFGKDADSAIFTPRPDDPGTSDIYNSLKPILGPWSSPQHRIAAMLEAMRVHAGFESSWNWDEGVDTTNKTSVANIRGQETGAWQVSFDSTDIHGGAMKPFAKDHHIDTPDTFIPAMKADHRLAMEYYARLVRINTKWAGPILRHEFDKWLSRDAVAEFQSLLAT